MKKTILSIAALSTFLFSCSDDDNNEVSSSSDTVEVCTNLISNAEGTAISIDDWTWKDARLNDEAIGDTDTLSGVLETDLTLDAGTKYGLSADFRVASGVTLTIPAGTQIEVTPADGESTSTFIAVLEGGNIVIEGTSDNPVVMSSTTAEAGDWGGLIVCGLASTTSGVDAIAEVESLPYGGEDDADSSGSINFLVIVGAGANISIDSQYNGLTLYAVGNGTTINGVAVINGDDDGVEFFGGTVEVTNFYSENNTDDAIDWTEGWSGSLTNAYVLHTSKFSTVVEADGNNGNPTITNLTAVATIDDSGTAFQFKKSSGATIENYNLTGYTNEFDIADSDLFVTENVIFDGNTVSLEEDCVEIEL